MDEESATAGKVVRCHDGGGGGEGVNTKSRLRPSVFSVRLFQTQCQLAAGDVSTNLSHFHWRSRTLGI